MSQFQQLEKPLGFDPVHSTTLGSPRSDKPGEYDWSGYDKQWDEIRASGIPKKSCLLLFAALPVYFDKFRRLQTMIANWLKAKPRLLVSVGPFGLYDEIGRDSGSLLNAAFAGRAPQLETSKGWQWGDGATLEGAIGPSRVIGIAKPVRQFKTDRKAMDDLLKQIEAAAARNAFDDKNVFEMVLRQQGRVRYLCVLNPNADDAAASNIRVKGAFKSVAELDYERAFPVPSRIESVHTVFPFRLEPGEATILRLSP